MHCGRLRYLGLVQLLRSCTLLLSDLVVCLLALGELLTELLQLSRCLSLGGFLLGSSSSPLVEPIWNVPADIRTNSIPIELVTVGANFSCVS